jgi:copper resistance protein B
MNNKMIFSNKVLSTAAMVCVMSTGTMAQQQNSSDTKAPVTQSAEDMPMDHSAMDHSKMDHSTMDHSVMGNDSVSETGAMQGMDHSNMQPMEADKGDMPMDHSAMDHSKMDHSTMNHSTMNHSSMGNDSMGEKDSMQGMDHSNMQPMEADKGGMPMDHSAMDHSKMQHSAMGNDAMDEKNSMQGMDHGSMASQSNTPPPNARDPHAYANGLTLDSGVFALPGPRQLKMADEHAFGTVLFDRFEYADGLSSGLGDATQYAMQAWYGSSYDRLVVKSEGEIVDNKLEGSENQILWGHAISTFWDTQLGVRFDTSEGPSRQWLTFGLQGLAPYWFEVSANLSVGSQGRSVIDLEAEYELLITQRLVLQPRIVLSAYGKDDEQVGVGKGLSSLTAGVRLRYEFTRQFAPYLGLEWTGQYGNTADFSQLEGRSTRNTQLVAGIRFWFQ